MRRCTSERFSNSGSRRPSGRTGSPPDHDPSGLADVRGLVLLDIAERKVSSIPTWPFDTQILGRFALAMVSLVAAVLARIILYVLRF